METAANFTEVFDAFTPPAEQKKVDPTYAMVEIFGHRQHWAEIRDVEIAGGKLLEVRDVDTQKVHLYGSGAIFSLTMLSSADVEAHVADVKRRTEESERWRRESEERRQARLSAPEVVEELPF
jgi:hypothetical protein